MSQSLPPTAFTISRSIVLEQGAIPLTWWTLTPNVGDLLSPFLVERMTGLPVTLVDNRPRRASLQHRLWRAAARPDRFSYLCIGSIVNRAEDRSIVWGSGAFGVEPPSTLNRHARYLAVRGPLTRNLLRTAGIECPPVYGDPALLLPSVFSPLVEKHHRVGLVLRHSETEWLSGDVESGAALIDMGRADVENVLLEMLACERIVTSSLHGLVLADTYGIPSAWLASTTPKGLEFKFYDYFLTVDKMRPPQQLDFGRRRVTMRQLDSLAYDDRPIRFDHERLLDACPFVEAWKPRARNEPAARKEPGATQEPRATKEPQP